MKKDDKGIIFSLDAVMALIPVLVVLLTLVNANIDYSHSNEQKLYFHEAQDSIEVMAQYRNPNGLSMLDNVSMALSDTPDQNQGIQNAKRHQIPF